MAIAFTHSNTETQAPAVAAGFNIPQSDECGIAHNS